MANRRGRLLVTVVAVTIVLVGLLVGAVISAGKRGGRSPATTVVSGRAHRTPTTDSPLRVLLLGDSLAWESQGAFVYAMGLGGTVATSVMAYGGTDYCTFGEALREHVEEERPEVVVIEFSGNALGACMADARTGLPLDGRALIGKYASDAEQTVSFLLDHDVEVYLATMPVTRTPHPEDPGLLKVIDDLVGRRPEVQLIDAASAVERPDGGYTDFLPCLPLEPCTKIDPATGERAARVRAPDGSHFCPTGLPAVSGVTLTCASWSSGAWRYGTALARPVLRRYGIVSG